MVSPIQETSEDDGLPTPGDPFDPRKPGEPNIDWTDLDESDMVGLTGFASPPFTSQNRISNDQFIFENYLTPEYSIQLIQFKLGIIYSYIVLVLLTCRKKNPEGLALL